MVGWENEFATLEIARGRCVGLALLCFTCAVQMLLVLSAGGCWVPSVTSRCNVVGLHCGSRLHRMCAGNSHFWGAKGAGCLALPPCCSEPVHCEARFSVAELIFLPSRALFCLTIASCSQSVSAEVMICVAILS